MRERSTRRGFLQAAALTGAALVGGATLVACGKDSGGGGGGGAKKLTCLSTSGLTRDEIQLRTTTKYADTSKKAGQSCENCQLYKAAPKAGACGSCVTIKGPIHPKGWCNIWAAKPS